MPTFHKKHNAYISLSEFHSTINALFNERIGWDLVGGFQLSENKGSPIENPPIFFQTPLNK